MPRRSWSSDARRHLRVPALLLAVGVAASCTAVVGGSVRPAPGLTPHPLTGISVPHVLLDRAELSRAYGQSFKPDPDMPDAVGGSDLLSGNAQTPPDCGGVVDMLLKDSYQGSDVGTIVIRNWLNDERDPVALLVHEAVVALPSAHDADVRFASMAQQWKGCGGASMTIDGDANFTSRIGTVEEKNSVLAATVDDISSYMVLPEARAVGVRVNCLVEMKVIYMAGKDRDGTGGHTPTAADVAHLLMDKVSSLAG